MNGNAAAQTTRRSSTTVQHSSFGHLIETFENDAWSSVLTPPLKPIIKNQYRRNQSHPSEIRSMKFTLINESMKLEDYTIGILFQLETNILHRFTEHPLQHHKLRGNCYSWANSSASFRSAGGIISSSVSTQSLSKNSFPMDLQRACNSVKDNDNNWNHWANGWNPRRRYKQFLNIRKIFSPIYRSKEDSWEQTLM